MLVPVYISNASEQNIKNNTIDNKYFEWGSEAETMSLLAYFFFFMVGYSIQHPHPIFLLPVLLCWAKWTEQLYSMPLL
jgi:hypothetical protein